MRLFYPVIALALFSVLPGVCSLPARGSGSKPNKTLQTSFYEPGDIVRMDLPTKRRFSIVVAVLEKRLVLFVLHVEKLKSGSPQLKLISMADEPELKLLLEQLDCLKLEEQDRYKKTMSHQFASSKLYAPIWGEAKFIRKSKHKVEKDVFASLVKYVQYFDIVDRTGKDITTTTEIQSQFRQSITGYLASSPEPGPGTNTPPQAQASTSSHLPHIGSSSPQLVAGNILTSSPGLSPGANTPSQGQASTSNAGPVIYHPPAGPPPHLLRNQVDSVSQTSTSNPSLETYDPPELHKYGFQNLGFPPWVFYIKPPPPSDTESQLP